MPVLMPFFLFNLSSVFSCSFSDVPLASPGAGPSHSACQWPFLHCTLPRLPKLPSDRLLVPITHHHWRQPRGPPSSRLPVSSSPSPSLTTRICCLISSTRDLFSSSFSPSRHPFPRQAARSDHPSSLPVPLLPTSRSRSRHSCTTYQPGRILLNPDSASTTTCAMLSQRTSYQ